MNRLCSAMRARVAACLVDGNSVRATCRLTGVALNTVLKFVGDLGRACQLFHDRTVAQLPCVRVQCDEAWGFCYAKDRNIPLALQGQPGIGSVWTWVAMCPDTNFVITWRVDERGTGAATEFLRDLRSRLLWRVQLTTDGYRSYLQAVPQVFGDDVDFGQLVKLYDSRGRYTGSIKQPLIGEVDERRISTSLVERQNLNLRMRCRRWTRRTNAFSKKVDNMRHAAAIHFVHSNFCWVPRTLGRTPAMMIGLSKKPWTLDQLANLSLS